MLQTVGAPWTVGEWAAMERYQQAGGGIVAIHSAGRHRPRRRPSAPVDA